MILLESENALENLTLHKFSESMSIAECGAEVMCEMEREWNSILQSQAIDMLAEQVALLREADEEPSAEKEEEKEEASKKGIWKILDNIIAALKKFAEWIGGFFAKVWEFLDKNLFSARKMLKDKKVCVKGAEILEAKGTKIAAIVDKNSTHKNISSRWAKEDDAVTNYTKSLRDEISKVIKDNEDAVKDYVNAHQARLNRLKTLALGENVEQDSDFDSKMTQKFAVEKGEVDITVKLLEDSFDFCEKGYKDAKKDAKTAYTSCKKSINDAIKHAQGLKREIDKKAEDYKSRKQCISLYTAELKTFINCMSRMNKEYFSYLSKHLSAAQTIVYRCYKASTTSGKKSGKEDAEAAAKQESAIDFGYGFGINLL